MASAAACTSCGTEDPERLYRSGKMKRCKDCQRFYNVTVNARRPRARERTPELRFDKEDFLAWSRKSEPRCAYCGIAESELLQVGLRSQIGLAVEALGIDRLDNGRDYELDNIAFCCFACNKVKGNVFTESEMTELVGPAVAEVRRERLGG